MRVSPKQPFTFAEGLAAGLTVRHLRSCTRLATGVLLLPDVAPTGEIRARGALVGQVPSAHVSHSTAARLLALPVPRLHGEHVTVSRPDERRRRADVHSHVRPNSRVVLVGGIRCSAPVQVFCESAGTVDLVDAVVLGDAIVSRALATQGDLIAAATAWRGGGRSAAVEAARAVRSGVRSVMESRLRMLMALAGLPEPEVNPVFRDERGEPVREYDLYYRASRTAVEYDGRQHIERERTWARDIARRERIDAVGDRVIVVTARDIFRDPAEKLSRVHAVLQERRQPGTPARLRREWELHFDQPHGHS